MDRRRFLASSIALVAAAGLPAAKRKQQNKPYIYKTALLANTPGQTAYELSIFHSAVSNFKSASDTEKELTLKIRYFKTSDVSYATSFGEYRYKIKKVEIKDDLYEVTTKYDEKIAGDHKLPKDFPKDLKFRIELFTYAKVLGKKDAELLIIPYPQTSDDDDSGCFLTTACVQHKQLADDCVQLNTLRDLRDKYMMNSADGQDLISNYKLVGPRIVKSINDCDNKGEIYNYMFDQLVTPSVKMIDEGRLQDAVEYYREFVKGLTAKYL